MVVARNYGIRKRIEERWFSTKCVLYDTLKNNTKKKMMYTEIQFKNNSQAK